MATKHQTPPPVGSGPESRTGGAPTDAQIAKGATTQQRRGGISPLIPIGGAALALGTLGAGVYLETHNGTGSTPRESQPTPNVTPGIQAQFVEQPGGTFGIKEGTTTLLAPPIPNTTQHEGMITTVDGKEIPVVVYQSSNGTNVAEFFGITAGVDGGPKSPAGVIQADATVTSELRAIDDQKGAASQIPLPLILQPGDTISVSSNVVAPGDPSGAKRIQIVVGRDGVAVTNDEDTATLAIKGSFHPFKVIERQDSGNGTDRLILLNTTTGEQENINVAKGDVVATSSDGTIYLTSFTVGGVTHSSASDISSITLANGQRVFIAEGNQLPAATILQAGPTSTESLQQLTANLTTIPTRRS